MTDSPAPDNLSDFPAPPPPTYQWREDVLTLIVRILFVFAMPVVLLDVITALRFQEYERIVVDTLVIGFLAALAFLNWPGYSLRAALIIGIIYAASVWALLVGGLVDAGRLYLVQMIVFAGLLLSRHATIMLWLVSAVTLAAIYGAFAAELIPTPTAIVTRIYAPLNLVQSWLIQTLLSAAIAATIVLIVSRLQQSVHAAEAARADLQRLNAELEQRVEERTAELHESQTILQAVIDNAPIVVVVKDRQGRYIMVNQRAATNLHLEPEHLIGKSEYDLFPSEYVDTFLASDRQVFETGQVIEVENTIPLDDPRTYLSIKFPLLNPQGEIYAVGAIANDITERKQAEERIRFQAWLLDNIGQAVIASTMDGTVTYWNRAAETLYGWSAVEAMGQDVVKLTTAADAMPISSEAMSRLLRGESWSGDFTGKHRDGSTFPTFVTTVPIRDEQGTLTGLIGISHDITERKQAEEALRESERFVQQIASTIPDIIYIYDLSLERNVYSNRQLWHILGYTPEDIQAMGQDVMPTLLHPDDLPRTIEHRAMHAQVPEGAVLTLEYRMQSQGRNWRWLLSQEVVFTRTADGQPQQILGIASDITERKQAEEALRTSEQRLQAIFDNAAVGIGLTDNAGKSIAVNARGAQQLGYTPEELAALSNTQMTHPDDQAETKERMQQLMRGEITSYRIEKRYFRKDGSIFWADLSVSAVYDDDGQIAYLLGIVVDITERKQAEEEIRALNNSLNQRAQELEALNRDLEAFGYAIAHHLRSPLWTVQLCAEAVYEEYSSYLDEDGYELLHTIQTTVRHMNQTIERLLTLAALTSEQISAEAVNLSQLVQEIVADLRRREPARQVMITVAPNVVAVGDARLLRMVLESLLENAWKYTSKRPVATISFAVQPQPGTEQHVYVVRDNGVGFDQARADDIFRAFRRLHPAKDFPGTGIGLAMVRRIVHLHGGDIWAEAARNQGAAFFFTLG